MNNFWTIAKKEFKRFFTDRRLVLSLILPGLFIYIFYSIMGSILPSIGQDNVPEDYVYEVARANIPNSYADTLSLVFEGKVTYHEISDYETNSEQYKQDVKNGKYDLLLNFDSDFEEKINEIRNGNTSVIPPAIEIYYLSTSDASNKIYSSAVAILVSSPNYNITTYSLNDSPDLADTNGIYTKVIASILPMIVISLLFSTCAAICPESIAGEKERGTIATLLVTPVKRYEVAAGKIFALSCISIIGGTFSFLGVVLSLPKIMQMSDATLSLGLLQYILMFLVIISCVVMIVSVMSLFSCFAKSIKEANSMISISMPVVLVFSLLAAFIKNNSLWITIIPIYNVSTALTQLVNNQYNGIFLALTISSNIAYSLIFGYLVVKMFNSERIMFSR